MNWFSVLKRKRRIADPRKGKKVKGGFTEEQKEKHRLRSADAEYYKQKRIATAKEAEKEKLDRKKKLLEKVLTENFGIFTEYLEEMKEKVEAIEEDGPIGMFHGFDNLKIKENALKEINFLIKNPKLTLARIEDSFNVSEKMFVETYESVLETLKTIMRRPVNIYGDYDDWRLTQPRYSKNTFTENDVNEGYK